MYTSHGSTIKADHLKYQDAFCEISRICEQFTCSIILLGGDYNTDVARSKSFNTF